MKKPTLPLRVQTKSNTKAVFDRKMKKRSGSSRARPMLAGDPWEHLVLVAQCFLRALGQPKLALVLAAELLTPARMSPARSQEKNTRPE